MAWTERQQAMLAEMGLHVWGATEESAVSRLAEPAAVERVAGAAPGRPAVPATATATATVAAASLAGAAVTVRAAGLDWPELRQVVAGCTACTLCRERRQTVFGVGHPRAHWMIVGEAPGEQEDAIGEPFVGTSGRLLDNMLRALGLGRASGESDDPARQVYIANTVKCRPPGNRNPEPAELAACEPYLRRQIELVQPRVILAMGRFAVQSLLHSAEPIGRLRGRLHRCDGVPVVVTYHPAYLLRQPEEKARAWDDLCLAWQTAQAVQAAQAGITSSS